MKGRVFIYLVACGLLALAGLIAATRAEVAPTTGDTSTPSPPGIDDWACPSGTVGRVSCAFVEVPEDYDDPAISNIRLFMARILPPLESTGEPLVFVGRTLGGVNVDEFGDWQQVSRATGREVILVDLRGSGRSEPLLSCPETRAVNWLESDLAVATLAPVRNEYANAVAVCKERLANTVRLDAYSLQAIVRDLDLIRTRLDIDRWTLVASGDATLVARTYEQQLPEFVESLVLLGATPSSASRDIARYDYANEVLDNVLTDDLAAALESGLEPLDARPFVFAVSVQGRTQRVSVNGEVILPILARAAGEPALLPLVPSLITERLANEQWRNFAVLRAQQYRPDSVAIGAALTTLCGDPSLEGARPFWESIEGYDTRWTGLVDDRTLDPLLCEVWDPPGHNGVRRAPSAPTLVINGENDISAPRSAALKIADEWTDAITVVLPDSGRPTFFNPCVTALLDEFLDGGLPTLDTTCS